MSISETVYQLNMEHVLHDVIHIVCKYAKAIDLSNMAKVCTSWRYAALREKGKRCYNQQLHLPYKIDNLTSRLDVDPCATLLIYDSRLEKSLHLPQNNYVKSNGLEEELLQDFKIQLPNRTMVLRVDRYLTMEDETSDILGLFFPRMEPRIRVDVAWMNLKLDIQRNNDFNYIREFLNENPIIDSFAEELGLHDECSKSCSTILLLTCPFGIENHNALLNQLDKRAKQNGKEIIWSSICGTKLVAAKHDENIVQSNFQNFAALRFSGPAVESWNTFIYFLATREEMESKLYQLKKLVKPKRHYIGLLYSLNCTKPECEHEDHPCSDSWEMMLNLKRIFPDIGFKGFFKDIHCWDYVNRSLYSDRSDAHRGFDREFLLHLEKYTSIIIIAYD